MYGNAPVGKTHEKKYGPAEYTGTKKRAFEGNPDKSLISTSYVERQNLTMRMHMHHSTRLTNGFRKKVENRMHAVALHFMYYNVVKVHQTLKLTPAIEAGLTGRLWDISDLVAILDANAQVPKIRGNYKPRIK